MGKVPLIYADWYLQCKLYNYNYDIEYGTKILQKSVVVIPDHLDRAN